MNEAPENLLDELFEEVKRWESHLAGGTELPITAQNIDDLRKTEIRFGNPYDNLLRLTEEMFQEVGVELTSIRRQQMEQYKFYYMTLPVILRPKPGLQFTQLECHLDFHPKGKKEPIVQQIFPQEVFRTVFKRAVGMDLALDGNLDYKLGIDTNDIMEGEEYLIKFRGKVENRNKMKARIVIPDYTYELGHYEIVAQGESSSTCYWRIEQPKLKATTIRFALVFKVPKDVNFVRIEGIASPKVNVNWLAGILKNVDDRLSERLKGFLRLGDEAFPQFSPEPVREEWRLELK